MRAKAGLLATAAGLVLVACGGGATSSAPTAASPPASPIVASDTVAVHGIEVCRIVEAVYEGTEDRETFHCTEATSDPRLNGEWETLVVTHETGGGLGAWSGDLVMENAGGTWRGKASGTTTGIGAHPVNLGVVVWTGEGGYAGLTYHEFVYGSNGRLVTAGWVEPTPQG